MARFYKSRHISGIKWRDFSAVEQTTTFTAIAENCPLLACLELDGCEKITVFVLRELLQKLKALTTIFLGDYHDPNSLERWIEESNFLH